MAGCHLTSNSVSFPFHVFSYRSCTKSTTNAKRWQRQSYLHGDSYLLSFPFCNAVYRSVVLSQTYVFLLAMLPPGYTLLLGIVEDFFLSGPTRGLAVISLFDPTVVLPSLRATSLSQSSFCSLFTLLAWGLLVYDTAGWMDGPAWSLKRRCFWFAEMLRWTFRWAGDCRVLLFKSLLGRDLWHKFPLDNDSPPSNYMKKKDGQHFKTKQVHRNKIHSWFSNLFQVIQGAIRNKKIKFGYRTETWQTGRERTS